MDDWKSALKDPQALEEALQKCGMDLEDLTDFKDGTSLYRFLKEESGQMLKVGDCIKAHKAVNPQSRRKYIRNGKFEPKNAPKDSDYWFGIDSNEGKGGNNMTPAKRYVRGLIEKQAMKLKVSLGYTKDVSIDEMAKIVSSVCTELPDIKFSKAKDDASNSVLLFDAVENEARIILYNKWKNTQKKLKNKRDSQEDSNDEELGNSKIRSASKQKENKEREYDKENEDQSRVQRELRFGFTFQNSRQLNVSRH